MTADAPPGDAPTAPMPPLRALVVDDIPEICDMYRAIFKRIRGIDVELTIETDPKAAMERLSENAYDLVVSDFRMKGADGIQVLSHARERNPHGRRVLMTGYNEIPTGIERIQAARIDAYLRKPLRTQDLLIMMSDLLRGDARAMATYREHADELELIAKREEFPRLTIQDATASGA